MTMRSTRLQAIAATYLAATIAAVAPAAAQQTAATESCCAGPAELWPEDPNTTRLLFWPTARTHQKGGVTLGVHGFVLPSVQVGVTDHFSIGGGTPLLFPLGRYRPYWITPKVRVLNHSKVQVAVGALQTLNLSGLGIAYAVATSGTSRGSVTVGGGVGYSSHGEKVIMIMAGGDRQVRRRMKFVTENYYLEGQGVISAGVRFFDEHKSLDAAVAAPINSYFYGLVPVLSFAYRF